jgi:hypothetical protein
LINQKLRAHRFPPRERTTGKEELTALFKRFRMVCHSDYAGRSFV